ncbi:hypothetical protein F7725_009102 [Dissostichus mawsoni]|uniref:Uncharacterized protein n=1 Tax=Dissostichus mawsoni TaxID=36200 RepID=A0A7J5Z6U4_DISMA|nr:hypothetical protein F7725_009102 [Dissostichus mawsoni]
MAPKGEKEEEREGVCVSLPQPVMADQLPPQQGDPLLNTFHQGSLPNGIKASKDGLHARGQWASKAEFLLAVAGQIIGLGNVWSFQAVLPWSHCNNTWNTVRCVQPAMCAPAEACVVFERHNQTTIGSSLPENATSSVMEFWESTPSLQQFRRAGSNQLEARSVSRHRLAVCYFCVWKGVKSTGKVVYLTATFPYVMLFVLLIRGATLPGATQGIIYYLKPNITRLADPQVWMDAGTQVFFSYGICLGSLTALGSYNKYNNDCYKDSFLLCLLNSITSFLAGFAIFSVLGFMAEEQGVDIASVAQSGPGLAFIAYPRAFVSLEALMTSVTDLYPNLIRRGHRRELLLLFICIICFLLGLVMVTPIYDHYSCSGASLLLLSIFQSLAIGWVYGAERFSSNIRDMTGYSPLPVFKLCWKYLTPAVCSATFVFSLVSWSPLNLGRGLVAPAWATTLGWLLTLSSVSLLPIWAIYALATTPGTLSQVNPSLLFMYYHISPSNPNPSKNYASIVYAARLKSPPSTTPPLGPLHPGPAYEREAEGAHHRPPP